MSKRIPCSARLLAVLLLALLALSGCGKDEDKKKEAARKEGPAIPAAQRGNQRQDSFGDAKRELMKKVYADHRVTIYCPASFDAQGNVVSAPGFSTPKHQARAGRIEWEHVVPAENFGRTFTEWREGHPDCQDRRGPFKGRKCAERANREYRLMQADMFNLYPAIGAVNAMRENYTFTMLPDARPTFGGCGMKIEGTKAEPPEADRGFIARTTRYMAWAYPRFNLSSQQEKLMDAWDRMYPVDEWECRRARRIEAIQGNENPLVKDACVQAKLW